MGAGAAVMANQSRSLVTLEKADVVRLMPQGPPWLVIESAELVLGERLEDSRITAFGKISTDFVKGHFRNRPVVPGSVEVEIIAQTILLLAVAQPGEKRREVMLVGLNKFSFPAVLLPEVEFRVEGQITSVRPDKPIGFGTAAIYLADADPATSKPFAFGEVVGSLWPEGTWARLLGNGQ